MANNHDPVVHHRADGRWEVNCPECLRLKASGVDVPVGIGLSVRSWDVAIRLWSNHIGLFVDSQDGPQLVITSTYHPLLQ